MSNTIVGPLSSLAALLILSAIACGTLGQTPVSTVSPTPTPTSASEPDSATLTLEEVVSRGERPFVNGPSQIRPGQSHRYTIAIEECCVFVVEVNAHIRWSATPATGATIDPGTGLFSVDAETPNGATFTITADIENGQFAPAGEIRPRPVKARGGSPFWFLAVFT